MKIKRIMISAAIFLWAFLIAAVFREIVWHFFDPPQSVGSTVQTLSDDPEETAQKWFEEYFDRLKGWTVPYEYRIVDVQIDQSEILTDLDVPYVQLDYTVRVASANDRIVQNLELAGTDTRNVYIGQMVLSFEDNGDGTYTLTDRLRPVQYQIRTPQFQEERNTPQTEHYKMNTEEPMTYYIADGVLYVTYDSGENLIEVPDGYEKVCGTENGTYNELLAYNSYIVTEEFTAFVAGNDLLYSMDQGETWQTSHITDWPSIANRFLSKTDSGYYVTIAVDRSLGNDYYATFYSSDLKTWTDVPSIESGWSGLDCVFWTADDRGYYARENVLWVTRDGGASYEMITVPEAVKVTADQGFNPFDTVERMYEEDGVLFLILGQGEDGDYVKDGVLMEALYRSEDGLNFTFVEEVADDTPEEAG